MMLNLFICALTFIPLSLLAAETTPFWKSKEKVYSRVSDGEIIVSVKRLENKSAPRYNLIINGGGHVQAPANFAFQTAQQFQDLVKISDYVKKSDYNPVTRILDFEARAYGYTARNLIEVVARPETKTLEYELKTGAMKGLKGVVTFLEIPGNRKGGPVKTEMGITGDYPYDTFPLPRVFLEFGIEVVLKKIAFRLRSYIEEQYKLQRKSA